MKRKKIIIPKSTLERLYISEKMNAYQIAKRLGCGATRIYRKLEECGIKRRDNSECHIRYEKTPFSRNKEEMAYLIGFRLGDLHVRKAVDLPGCKTIRVEAHTTKQDQIKLVNSLFKKYTHIHNKEITAGTRGVNTFRILCFLDRSFSFLLPKKDKIENWIMENKSFLCLF